MANIVGFQRYIFFDKKTGEFELSEIQTCSASSNRINTMIHSGNENSSEPFFEIPFLKITFLIPLMTLEEKEKIKNYN
jgi:hypothetical protein